MEEQQQQRLGLVLPMPSNQILVFFVLAMVLFYGVA
jgi:hypothetical protein